jgi:hypothetical protein
MPWYFFHLVGQLSAEKFFSEPYASEHEAKEFGGLLARNFQRDMPGICSGSYTSVTNDRGREISQILLSTTH